MRLNNWLLLFFSFISIIGYTQNSSVSHDFSLELEGEYRFFFEKGAFSEQERHFPSIAIRPDYSISWNKGYDEINFVGFARWDRDDQRTHADLREMYYQRARGKW